MGRLLPHVSQVIVGVWVMVVDITVIVFIQVMRQYCSGNPFYPYHYDAAGRICCVTLYPGVHGILQPP